MMDDAIIGGGKRWAETIGMSAGARPEHGAMVHAPRAIAQGPLLCSRPDSDIIRAMHACHFCGASIGNPREVYRSSTCPACRRDLKICLNCRFYSPGSHWDCAETIDEPVGDKERASFCTFFQFRDAPTGAMGASRPTPGEQAKRKLDRLFGNGT
jgi:hypothetical protein